jgi:hypothetical protein
VATSIDAPQHVRVDTRGSQTEGIKDVASLRLALSPINFNHGTTNHAVHHFVIHCYLLLSLFVIVVTLNSNHASSRLIHSGPTKYSTRAFRVLKDKIFANVLGTYHGRALGSCCSRSEKLYSQHADESVRESKKKS